MMFKQRDIVLVPFTYSDLSATKRRPILVVSNNIYNKTFPDVLVCVITTNLKGDNYSIFLADTDLEFGILPEPSVIKCHKLYTVQQSKNLKIFSVIDESKFDEVVRLLDKLIKKSN